MGAEIVFPRACQTAEPEIQLEIDAGNQIFQLHEGAVLVVLNKNLQQLLLPLDPMICGLNSTCM